MKAAKRAFLPVCFLVLLGTTSGQQTSHHKAPQTSAVSEGPALAKLVPSGDPIETAQPVLAGFVGPVRCYYGVAYLRPIAPDIDQPLSTPLIGLSLDGKFRVQFDLKSVPEFSEKQFVSPIYAVDKSGSVYFIVRLIDDTSKSPDHSHEKTYIVKFSADGTYSSTVTLDQTLWPYSLAVFPSGNMLISGTYRAPYEQGTGSPKSITAIFAGDGRLKRELTSQRGNAGDATNPKPMAANDAVMGPDDLLYILKYGREPTLQVWSEAGEEVRELKLKPPFKNASGADTLLVTQGTIAVRFEGPVTNDPAAIVYGIYDSYTGQPRRYYEESIKGRMICLEGEQFTYLIMKSEHYAFQRVEGQ